MPRKAVPKEAPAAAPVQVEQRPAEASPPTITNCLKGTTLHLSDGRRLAYGESAEVSHEEAEFLIGRGQAE